MDSEGCEWLLSSAESALYRGGRRCRREAYRAVRWGGIAPSAAGTGAARGVARGAARGVRGIGGAARAIETAGNESATRTAGETAAHAAANATESANGAAKARPTRSKRLCVLSLVEGSPHTQQRSLPHTRGAIACSVARNCDLCSRAAHGQGLDMDAEFTRCGLYLCNHSETHG